MTLMHEFVALQDGHNRRELAQTKDEIESQRNRMLSLLVIGLILSLLIAFWVTRRIQHEIDRRNRIEAELETRVEERTWQLEQLARKDHITALPNRAAFTMELTSALTNARSEGKRVALFFMDLDGFKQVNDTHGHGIGDRVLVEISQRLRKVTDGKGFLFRVGGDEFTLIIRDAKGDAEVRVIAEEIITMINQPLLIDGQHFYIGISIGCAISNGVSISFDDFLTHADDAMYSAKRAGKNRLVFA
jgi:diguanylate cyclase (GGDEF)-like protein